MKQKTKKTDSEQKSEPAPWWLYAILGVVILVSGTFSFYSWQAFQSRSHKTATTHVEIAPTKVNVTSQPEATNAVVAITKPKPTLTKKSYVIVPVRMVASGQLGATDSTDTGNNSPNNNPTNPKSQTP